jgi:hypothetical protein
MEVKVHVRAKVLTMSIKAAHYGKGVHHVLGGYT